MANTALLQSPDAIGAEAWRGYDIQRTVITLLATPFRAAATVGRLTAKPQRPSTAGYWQIHGFTAEERAAPGSQLNGQPGMVRAPFRPPRGRGALLQQKLAEGHFILWAGPAQRADQVRQPM